MSNVTDLSLADKGIKKINWVDDFMPVLNEISKDFKQSKPFKGKTIAISMHVEAKTAKLALALRDAGAKVYVTGCNPDSTQDDIAAGLVKLGINVFAKHGVPETIYRHHLKEALGGKPDLIIDDGGDLLDTFIKLPDNQKWHILGGCEETTTGINHLHNLERDGTLPFPMMNVNDAKSKHYYDNKYGTGQSVWTAIMDTTNLIVAGKTVVIAGYGWCGKGVAMRAQGMGARIVITEIDPFKARDATMQGYTVMPMDEAAKIGDIFITTTGCKDVIVKRHFERMKNNALLANAGHFDVEINLKDLEELSTEIRQRKDNITGYKMPSGKTLNLLANGRLVNLAAGKGHPAEIMDMSFSVQILGLLYVMKHSDKLGNLVYDIPESIDEQIAKYELHAMGIHIDELTPMQQAYLYGYEL